MNNYFVNCLTSSTRLSDDVLDVISHKDISDSRERYQIYALVHHRSNIFPSRARPILDQDMKYPSYPARGEWYGTSSEVADVSRGLVAHCHHKFQRAISRNHPRYFELSDTMLCLTSQKQVLVNHK